MNCKPGDLALIVKSVAGNEGRVVTVERFIGSVPGFAGDDYWQVDAELLSKFGARIHITRDSWLRPIRPGDISDEEVRDLYAPKTPEAA